MSTNNQPTNIQPAEDRNPEDAAQGAQAEAGATQPSQPSHPSSESVDGLKDKKPEELTPDELRLMADTMPGEGPGD
ncbi:MAG TPA: hypothetical protein DDZ22_05600 [Massilia sp.]|nr:hypothetical protein [Massilia sp.]